MTDGWDDKELLAELEQALSRRRAVPPEFVAAAKSAYAWRNIDAELAEITYDSTCDYAPIRAEAASIRALTFSSAHLSIELEVMEDALFGQVLPAQAAVVEVQAHPGGEEDQAHPGGKEVQACPDGGQEILTDEIGCFTIRPIPRSPFRLSCRVPAGFGILTSWLTL